MAIRVSTVHHRPLALVSVLAAGDYLLWNWSLQGSHDVLALVSGLTLPPLAIALIWLLALNVTRLLARAARTPRQQSRGGPIPQQQLTQDQQQTGGERQQQTSSSSKLAA
jgi:hypothetical protein